MAGSLLILVGAIVLEPARAVRRRPWLLLAVLLAAGGCTEQRLLWVRPDYTPELFARDRYECLRDAREPGMAVVLPAREWGRVVVPALVVPGSLTVNDGMFRACMTAKGWRLTAVDPSAGAALDPGPGEAGAVSLGPVPAGGA